MTIPSEFLPFRPLVFLLMYSNNRTSFDSSAYNADVAILYKYYYQSLLSLLLLLLLLLLSLLLLLVLLLLLYFGTDLMPGA